MPIIQPSSDTCTDNMRYIHDFQRYSQKDSTPILGGVTICYKIVDNGNTINYSIARCNKKDHYSKKIGLQLARARMINEDFFTLEFASCLDAINSIQNVIIPAIIKELNFFCLTKTSINGILKAKVFSLLREKHYLFDSLTKYKYKLYKYEDDDINK